MRPALRTCGHDWYYPDRSASCRHAIFGLLYSRRQAARLRPRGDLEGVSLGSMDRTAAQKSGGPLTRWSNGAPLAERTARRAPTPNARHPPRRSREGMPGGWAGPDPEGPSLWIPRIRRGVTRSWLSEMSKPSGGQEQSGQLRNIFRHHGRLCNYRSTMGTPRGQNRVDSRWIAEEASWALRRKYGRREELRL